MRFSKATCRWSIWISMGTIKKSEERNMSLIIYATAVEKRKCSVNELTSKGAESIAAAFHSNEDSHNI
ncbi:LOW QUALITY PROTEIN: hypothetical protein ACHAWF_015234 [Thalassiosira exigua]